MGWIGIIEVIILVLIIMTAIIHPKETIEYGRCMLDSAYKLVRWIAVTIKNVSVGAAENNQSIQKEEVS